MKKKVWVQGAKLGLGSGYRENQSIEVLIKCEIGFKSEISAGNKLIKMIIIED